MNRLSSADNSPTAIEVAAVAAAVREISPLQVASDLAILWAIDCAGRRKGPLERDDLAALARHDNAMIRAAAARAIATIE